MHVYWKTQQKAQFIDHMYRLPSEKGLDERVGLYVWFLNSHFVARNSSTLTLAHTIKPMDVQRLQEIYLTTGLDLQHEVVVEDGKERSRFTLFRQNYINEFLAHLETVYELKRISR